MGGWGTRNKTISSTISPAANAARIKGANNMAAQGKVTFGVIVGNRGFFPDHLAKSGREEIIKVLEAAGANVVVLGPEDSKYGAVETYAESQKLRRALQKACRRD